MSDLELEFRNSGCQLKLWDRQVKCYCDKV